MADVHIDPAVSAQLTEATHALYRAALALESVQTSTGAPVGGRCPFLTGITPPAPGDGPVSMLASPVAFDDALAGITEASDRLKGLEVPDLDSSNELAPDDLTIASVAASDAIEHPVRSDEFLQGLANDLNAVAIHGVFEAGLTLHGALQRTTDPRAREQIEEAIAILDQMIRKMRSVIFDRGRVEQRGG